MRGGPAAERGGGAGLVHHRDERAEEHEEDEDADVVSVRDGLDVTVGKHVDDRALERELRPDEAAGEDAEEERGVDLLGDEREHDGQQRREHGPERAVGGALLADRGEGLLDVLLEGRVLLDVVGVSVDVALGGFGVGEVDGFGGFGDGFGGCGDRGGLFGGGGLVGAGADGTGEHRGEGRAEQGACAFHGVLGGKCGRF